MIHQGTYATELLAFTGCIIGLWELSRRLCAAMVLLQAFLTVIVYGLNGVSYNVRHQLDPQMVGLTIVALAMTVGALWHLAAGPKPRVDDAVGDELVSRTSGSDHGVKNPGGDNSAGEAIVPSEVIDGSVV